MQKFIAYLRVSTKRQGESGHGLEAQRTAITEYLNGGEWELLAEFVEIESGKKNDRPKLQEALHLCQLTGATLIVAKLDRLSRDNHFITGLQKAGTKFIAADLPEANEMIIGMLAVIAQYERKLICDRTKAALKAAKERGPVYCERRGRMTNRIGSTFKENLKEDSAQLGRQLGAAANKAKADKFAASVIPIIQHHQTAGLDFAEVADKLNSSSIKTARGKTGTWTAKAVRHLQQRAANLT